MFYVLTLGAGLFVEFVFGIAYYSNELVRLSEENIQLMADNMRLSGERDRYRDAQDTFKTKQRMNWGA